MIEKFQEHTANERTFLAWTRTAIAIAGFGVLIEKLPNTAPALWAGLVLVGLSALLVAASTARFLVIRQQLNRGSADSKLFAWIEVLFAVMLALLLATLFFFLVRLVR